MSYILSTIKDISYLSGEYGLDINSLSEIRIDDNSIAQGQFGTIYTVQTFNGIEYENQFIVKILNNQGSDSHKHGFETISNLHVRLNRIDKTFRQEGKDIYELYPGLIGLPILAFRCVFNGEVTYALLSYNLKALGFIELEDILTGSTTLKSDDNDVLRKATYALHFARTVQLLHSINFIHADLKAESVFINPVSWQCAIIDYDSGALTDTVRKRPTTFGALQEWLALNIFPKIFKNPSVKEKAESEISIEDDRWSLGLGIHELMFDRIPFFFLKEWNHEVAKEYLTKYSWPLVDKIFGYYNNQVREEYNQYINLWANFKSDKHLKALTDLFEKLINRGAFQKENRPTANDWVNALSLLVEAEPMIHSFDASENLIKDKQNVNFTWKASNFTSVRIKGHNKQLRFLNDVDIYVEKEGNIEILVSNIFGRTSSKVLINTDKTPPVISYFIGSKYLRNDLNPIILSWQTSRAKTVTLQPSGVSLEASGSVEITPTQDTLYHLVAENAFGVSSASELDIRVIKPEIKKFEWEIDINISVKHIKLIWETENANTVEIHPKIGNVQVNGEFCLPINTQTTFQITAKGFFDESKSQLVAFPFPAPVIESLLIPVPELLSQLEINGASSLRLPNMPDNLFGYIDLDYSKVTPIGLDNYSLETNTPDFNMGIPKFTSLDIKWISEEIDKSRK